MRSRNSIPEKRIRTGSCKVSAEVLALGSASDGY
jgi:hypothetical protein